MFKRIMIAAVSITLYSILLFSCSENSNPVTSDKSAKGKVTNHDEIKIEDVGRLHNEILYKFNKKVPLLSRDHVDIDIFAENFVNSVNEVFKENNFEQRITKKDFALVMKNFLDLKKEGIINFFELPEGVPSKSIYSLADAGYFSKKSAERYINVIKDLQKRGKNSFIFRQDSDLIVSSNLISEEASKYALFTDIAKNSYTFWDDLYTAASSDTTDPDDPNKPVKTILWDAAGGLIGCAIPVPGASIITGAAASIAYYECGDYYENWILDFIADLF